MNGRFLVLALMGTLAFPSAAAEQKLPEEYRRWLEEEVPYIITDKEKDVFLSLTTREERELFIRAFWARRDLNRATLKNEFQEEHYRRLEYANRVLGRDTARPGWITDRGRYYIILGEPAEIQRYDGYNELVSIELWFYRPGPEKGLPPFFNLLFFKEKDIGEYRLYHPNTDGPLALMRSHLFLLGEDNTKAVDALAKLAPDLARASLQLDLTEPVDFMRSRVDSSLGFRAALGNDVLLAAIAKSPLRAVSTAWADAYLRYRDRVSAEYSFNYVPHRSTFAVLYGPRATPFVHYSIELDPEHFSLEANEDRTRFYTTLDASLELRDRSGNLTAVYDNTVYLELTASQMRETRALPFAYQDDFPVLPGEYSVSLLLRNRASKQYAVAEKPLAVPPLQGAALSDVILGYQEELAPVAAGNDHLTFQIGSSRIHPAADATFVPGETAYAFFQVEGADPDDLLRFALLSGDKKLAEREKRVSDYHGGPVSEPFTLSGMIGGTYVLQVRLLDPIGRLVAERNAEILVSPRSSLARPGFSYRRGFNAAAPGLLAFARGQQLMAMGRFAEAERELEESVSAGNPKLAMARWKLAGVYLISGKSDQALALLLPMRDEFPNEYEVVEGLGLAYHQKQDFAQATTYLERALSLRPPNVSVLNALGDSYDKLGKPDRARSFFERSLQLDPQQEAVKRRLASLKGS
jgi:GWxTD domain-containing protein